jgi:hypothetical protein
MCQVGITIAKAGPPLPQQFNIEICGSSAPCDGEAISRREIAAVSVGLVRRPGAIPEAKKRALASTNGDNQS